MRAFIQLCGRYDAALVRRPILVKSVTSAALTSIADATAQSLERRDSAEQRSHDFVRTARQLAYSAAFAPVLHGWYNLLTSVPRLSSPFLRVLADQTVFSPLAHISFFTYMTLAKGGGIPDVAHELDVKFLPAMAANYAIWPIAQAVNFSLVPLRHRVLFVNAVGMFYSTFLSGLAHASGPPALPSFLDSSSKA